MAPPSMRERLKAELVFGIFAALAEFERALISERTKVGLASARARGRNGGGQYKMTPAQVGVTRQTLYRHLGPDGALRHDG